MTEKFTLRFHIIVVRMLACIIALLLDKDSVKRSSMDDLGHTAQEWLTEAQAYEEEIAE